MKSRRRAALVGLGAAAAYLVGAAISGHLSPLARRPVLDGFAPPPPYRFVKPPPNLASINKPPLPGRYTVKLTGASGGEGLFATRDSQASILLLSHAFRPSGGARAVRLTLRALAPASDATLPDHLSITGNVYAIRATLHPAGTAVKRLARPGVVTLVYPALAGPHLRHVVLGSSDGARYTELSSTDSPVLQQVTAHTQRMGFFAVGVRLPSSATTPSGGGNGSAFPVAPVIITVAVVAAAIIGWLRWRARRRAGSSEARRPGPSRRRR